MMMFRIAATRPARLTAPVGAAAPNRPHDMALVQTTLKLKRDGKGQPYYPSRIDGWFSTKTQTALAAFQQATAPIEANRPMDNAGQSLRLLAETRELLVLEGSSVPYLPAPYLGEPQIAIGPGSEIAEPSRSALIAIAKRIAQDVRINLKVRVVEEQASRDGTLALFDLHALSVVLWNGQTAPVTDAYTLSHSAPSLKASLGKLIAEVAKELAPKGEDWRLLDSPAGILARLHLGRADGVKRRFQGMARLGRAAGLELAPRFLERYLSGAGGHVTLSKHEALAFEPIRDAMAENVERFNEQRFFDPRRYENLIAAGVLDRITDPSDISDISLVDYYDADFRKGEARYNELFFGEYDQFLATGQSKFRSFGQFNTRRVTVRTELGTEFWLEIEGSITHSWRDTYDFAPGLVFGNDALLLAKLRGAKPFTWKADWVTEHKATMRIISREKREWIRKL